jgi:hypothetical protein
MYDLLDDNGQLFYQISGIRPNWAFEVRLFTLWNQPRGARGAERGLTRALIGSHLGPVHEQAGRLLGDFISVSR